MKTATKTASNVAENSGKTQIHLRLSKEIETRLILEAAKATIARGGKEVSKTDLILEFISKGLAA